MPNQAQVIDNQVSLFEDTLKDIVAAARAEVLTILGRKLSVVDGIISKTKSNQRVLQDVDRIFQRAMKRAGYDALVQEYVRTFNGQFDFFQDTLDLLGKEIGRDLTITFSARDKRLFVQQQVSTVQMLDSVVDQVAANAERSAMFSVGGLKVGQLTAAIAQHLDETVGRATTLADTSLSTFYRTISDRGYRMVERDLPASIPAVYKYAGPSDKLVRPFCRKCLAMTAAGQTWTRAQIDAMINGQLPNVFLTCGGFNCRHQWVMVLRVMAAGE